MGACGIVLVTLCPHTPIHPYNAISQRAQAPLFCVVKIGKHNWMVRSSNFVSSCLLPFAIRPSTTICLFKTKIPCALVRYRLYRKCSRMTFGWNSANHDKTQERRKAQRTSPHHRQNSKHDQFWWVLLRVALGKTTPSAISRSSETPTTC